MKQKRFAIIGLCLYVILFSTALTSVKFEEVQRRWTNKFVVKELGFIGYAIFDLTMYTKNLYTTFTFKYKDPKPYSLFLLDRAKTKKTKRLRDNHSNKNLKNVIYLQLESVDDILLGLTHNDSIIMPFLSGLTKRSIHFKNAFDQTGAGRSVDGEFISLTSQMPIPNSSVYTSFDLSRIPSIPKVLAANGYHNFSVHGYIPTFWQRKSNHIRLGYDSTYFKEDLDTSDIIGWGVSDISVVEQAVDKMSQIKGPFFAHIILLTNHHPYNYVKKKNGIPLTNIVEDYFSSVSYVDTSIERLFKRLSEEDMLKDTIIAIYSDHDSGITKDIYLQQNLQYADDISHDKIPMMIYNDGYSQIIVRPSGLQDLAPTVLNLLGIEQPLTFLGAPASEDTDVFLLGNRRITAIKEGKPILEDSNIDLSTLSRFAISRPKSLMRQP